MRTLRRLLYWLHFRAHDDDLREELATHHAMLRADLARRGLDANDADARADRAMGNQTFMREEARAVWLAPRVEALLQDWRYASRGLRRAPAFALVAIVSLGIGIGANTAIFSLIHALLLAQVPVPAADELVQLRRDLGQRGFDDRFSHEEALAVGAGPTRLTSFSSTTATLDAAGAPMSVSVDAVDANYFELLRLGVARGRGISPNDNADGARVVVITDRVWHGVFNADPDALGRAVKINGQSFTIVGIMPPGFAGLRFPANTALIVPYRTATTAGLVRDASGRGLAMTIVGRRASGLRTEDVHRAIAPVWERCCADGRHVNVPGGQTVGRAHLAVRDVSRGIVHPKIDLRGQYSRILLAMMAGVGILLLAACANVANLLLARSSARMSELAVRVALGASRGRLVTQLAIESVQLSLLGAAFGLVLARWGLTILARPAVGTLSVIVPATIASSVLAFSVGVSLVCGLAFGVIPALRVVRTDLIAPLKQGGRRAAQGRRGWIDRGLVAVQMALALLLVTGASLLVETLRNLEHTDLGFDPTQRMAITVETRRTSYEHSGMTAQIAEQMLGRVRGLPGVQSAGFGSLVPIYGGRSAFDLVRVPGVDLPPDADHQTAFVGVTPGYFSALGMAMIAGRDIDRPTTASSRITSRDVVVNEAFAQKYFPNQSAIGRLFQDNDEGDSLVTTDRIVGVVASARYLNPREPATPTYYVQVADGDWPFLALVVRPSAEASSVMSSLERAIQGVAPGINVGSAELLTTRVHDAMARERMSATLAALFGGVALLLVAVGLYGVMLYQVAERTTEIGIRMALGARAESVVALVLRDSFIVAAVGVVVGFPLALLAGHAVASQLYGVAPYSIAALGFAAASLVGVTLMASFVPVRRAVAVDPLTALRSE
jgi:putative ABC transport system permease protein